MIIFRINRLGVFGRVYNITETIINRNLRAFIDFMSLELEVPTICLVTGGVSGHVNKAVQKLSFASQAELP
jgi:hypothetical protein